MNYFIYIDEGGDFAEGIKAFYGKSVSSHSAVGGICSRLNDEEWKVCHEQTAREFSFERGVKLEYPEHFHAADLIAGKIEGTEGVARELRYQFAVRVFNEVLNRSKFGLISINNDSRFQFSRQASYGVHLVAILKASLDHLAEHVKDCDRLQVMIARRTINETCVSEKDSTPYMQDLLPFLRGQLLSGDVPGAKLACRLKADEKLILCFGAPSRSRAGLIAADFVCLARNHRDLAKRIVVQAEPEDILFGDFEAFYKGQVDRLVTSQHYAAAVAISHSCLGESASRVLKALEAERDREILGRELAALLAEARRLIENRTIEARALSTARQILESLFDIAEKLLVGSAETPLKRRWADLLINGLADLAACHNHAGEIEPQRRIEQKIGYVLAEYGSLASSTYYQKKEIILEAKTRNLNLLFNNYQFLEVVDLLEANVRQREAELPANTTDELLGKMFGSLGQAYAFAARTQAGWNSDARDFLKRSERHFACGTLFHSMTVNYLATLAFQECQLGVAWREMNNHANLPDVDSVETLMSDFQRFAAHEKANAFDAVNYARIAALCVEGGGLLNVRALEATFQHWMRRLQNEHPYEQICKWLAYLFYFRRDFARASELCERGIGISRSLGFTVQTIGISLLGLNALCRAKLHDHQGYGNNRHSLTALANKLSDKSTPFSNYIELFGGAQGLASMVDDENPEAAKNICRSLPFAYM